MNNQKLEMQGFETAPEWLRFKYRDAVNFICQGCHKHEKDVGKLQPHRIKRGNLVGLYTVLPINHINSNIKVLCKDCHKKIHSNEFKQCRSIK